MLIAVPRELDTALPLFEAILRESKKVFAYREAKLKDRVLWPCGIECHIAA